MRFRTPFAVVAILFALPALARDKPQLLPVAPPAPPTRAPATLPAAAPALVTKVFVVAELVTPDPLLSGDAAAADVRRKPDQLVKLVTSTVRPHSWEANGGRGTAEFFDIGSALVVTQTPDVMRELSDLLDAMHRLTAVSVCYELRVLTVPAGFGEKAGLKLTRDTALTAAQLTELLEAAQGRREASVVQAPRVVARDDETATVKVGEARLFATGIDAVKVKGQTVCVPKTVPVHLGDTFTVRGRMSADGRYVHVHAGLTRTRLAGDVELTPVVTQITPVFEGGSRGKPVPFTQYLQVPDVRTEHAERTAVVPNGGTLVVGGWKETGEPQGKKPGTEFEVVVLATVRASKVVDLDLGTALVAPRPPAPTRAILYKLRNVAAADAASALNGFLEGKKLTAAVTAEPELNNVCVRADEAVQKQVTTLLEALDREPAQVVASAVVLEVPRGFAARAGLTGGAPALTPREAAMFAELIRNAKEKGACDVLSRPQVQVCDNQTGFVRVGQEYPVTTGFDVALVNWNVVVVPKTKYVPLGVTLRLTPRVSADGERVVLRTHAEVVTPAGGAYTAFTTRTIHSTAEVPFGHTLVLSATAPADRSLTGAVRSLCDPIETLVLVTPHRVRAAPGVRPAGWFTR